MTPSAQGPALVRFSRGDDLTGRIDLATLQALTRAEDPVKILSEYGLVIVDECHHVAAKTFAATIRSIPARRWLGLTATLKRPDRREEIMFMHCGPVRHKIPSETDLVQELHVHPTGIDVADRGRLRPEIWEQYHAAHPA